MQKALIMIALSMSLYSCNFTIDYQDCIVELTYQDNTKDTLELVNATRFMLDEGDIITSGEAFASGVKRYKVLEVLKQEERPAGNDLIVK